MSTQKIVLLALVSAVLSACGGASDPTPPAPLAECAAFDVCVNVPDSVLTCAEGSCSCETAGTAATCGTGVVPPVRAPDPKAEKQKEQTKPAR